MATVPKAESESTISSEALDLLDCFANGFDEIMYHMAEDAAVLRTGQKDPEIETEDLKSAATLFVSAVQGSTLPSDVKTQIADMLNCFHSKLACRK